MQFIGHLNTKISTMSHSLRIPENNDDRVPTEEHLTDESVLVNWESFLFTFPCLGYLHRTKN